MKRTVHDSAMFVKRNRNRSVYGVYLKRVGLPCFLRRPCRRLFSFQGRTPGMAGVEVTARLLFPTFLRYTWCRRGLWVMILPNGWNVDIQCRAVLQPGRVGAMDVRAANHKGAVGHPGARASDTAPLRSHPLNLPAATLLGIAVGSGRRQIRGCPSASHDSTERKEGYDAGTTDCNAEQIYVPQANPAGVLDLLKIGCIDEIR